MTVDPLTALLVLTIAGILLRQHALVQAGRLRIPDSPPSPRRANEPVRPSVGTGRVAATTSHGT